MLLSGFRCIYIYRYIYIYILKGYVFRNPIQIPDEVKEFFNREKNHITQEKIFLKREKSCKVVQIEIVYAATVKYGHFFPVRIFSSWLCLTTTHPFCFSERKSFCVFLCVCVCVFLFSTIQRRMEISGTSMPPIRFKKKKIFFLRIFL